VTILWVAVRASLYKETEIAEHQTANDPAKPLGSLEPWQVDAELVKIAEKIKDAVSHPITPSQQGARGSPPQPMPGKLLISKQPFEPEMILIPAGEFLMGSEPQQDQEAQDDEQPQHFLYLADYYLAKTPVTNAQYAVFVRATHQQGPEYWRERRPPRGVEDCPVVYISWFDAMAYCRWLSEATVKTYSLPSEAEWEKGARGTDGRIYPWGNEWDKTRCNSNEGGQNNTTPVGTYPQGASPYGLLDMAGNVLDWTRSLWGDYPYPRDKVRLAQREDLQAGEDKHRVLRGGAFNSISWLARCAFRYGINPYSRYRYLGFRVVVPPPS
jgi:formylglycine-generating enzyme required for sulfatase activity